MLQKNNRLRNNCNESINSKRKYTKSYSNNYTSSEKCVISYLNLNSSKILEMNLYNSL